MILAVDPGYSNYGYAIINKKGKPIHVGVLKTEASKRKLTRVSDDNAVRIASLTTDLATVIKHYKIRGVIGELPISGGQNARAVAQMAMAAAISVSVFTLFKLPTEWYTPQEVKVAFTNNKKATKENMMETACTKYGWVIQVKPIYFKNGKFKREDKIYFPLGEKMGKNQFEHIADALAVYDAAKIGNIVRMFTD